MDRGGVNEALWALGRRGQAGRPTERRYRAVTPRTAALLSGMTMMSLSRAGTADSSRPASTSNDDDDDYSSS